MLPGLQQDMPALFLVSRDPSARNQDIYTLDP